jgi:hypothetical protein
VRFEDAITDFALVREFIVVSFHAFVLILIFVFHFIIGAFGTG